MTYLANFVKQSGISIFAYRPTIDPSAGTYIVRGQIIDNKVVEKLQSYSHELSNDGGYKSCSITLGGSQSYLDEWYENGIGRHIDVYSSGGVPIWQGFVNRITQTTNTLQASRGPLIDICNRASVVYTPIIDTSVAPPITGVEKSTIIAEDTNSQSKYGIIEKVLSGGQLLDDGTTNEAEDYRDRFLDENREPDTSDKGISLGNSGDPAIQLEILGYYAWLGLYIYSSVTTGTTTVSAKMQTILGADPNGIFSTNYSNIEANNLLVTNYDNSNRTAKTIIEEMFKRGNDTTDERRIFGVFENQRIYYNTIPSDFTYYYKLSNRDQNIRLFKNGESGAVIQPWDVMPGKWLFIGDFLPGRFTNSTNKKADPRAMFIESVSFTAPHGLSLNGIGVSELPQYLAKLGIK